MSIGHVTVIPPITTGARPTTGGGPTDDSGYWGTSGADGAALGAERVEPNEREIEVKTNASGELYVQDSAGRVSRLYRFHEALALARISTATYYAWVKRDIIRDANLRDGGKWRVFTESEVQALVRLAREHSGQVVPAASQPRGA